MAFEEYVGGGQSSVATQIYFNCRCEPPEIESRSAGDEKCCFCEIVFGGNALKCRVGKPRARAGKPLPDFRRTRGL